MDFVAGSRDGKLKQHMAWQDGSSKLSNSNSSSDMGAPNFCDLPADLQERIIDRAVRNGARSRWQLAQLRTIAKSFRRAASWTVCVTLAPASLREHEVDLLKAFPSVKCLDLSNAPTEAVMIEALQRLPEAAPQLTALVFHKNYPDHSLSNIAKLGKLQKLELSGVGFTETKSQPEDPMLEKHWAVGPPCLGPLSSLDPLASVLTELLVEGAGQFCGGVAQLTVLTGLRRLQLRGFSMHQDQGLLKLSRHCTRLQSLSILNRREYKNVSLDGLEEMTALTALHLQGVGRIEPCRLANVLGSLTTLVKLDLPEYTLDGEVGGRAISRLTNLRAICISGDNYYSMEAADGQWLSGLGRLSALTSAAFSGFVDMDFDTFCLTADCWSDSLRDFKVEATEDFGPEHVGHICERFGKLTSLTLSNVPNALTNGTCATIAKKLTTLQRLDTTGFAGSEAPHGLQHLARLPALTRWSLRAGGDLDLAPIGCHAQALTLLDLTGAELAPDLDVTEQLQALQQLPGLRSLDLSVWGLQPAAAAVVAALPKLQALSLASSTTTDAAIAELTAATGLTSVDLSGCRYITPKGVRAALCALPHLEVLRLEDAGREGFAKDAWPPRSAFHNHFIGIDRRTDETALDG